MDQNNFPELLSLSFPEIYHNNNPTTTEYFPCFKCRWVWGWRSEIYMSKLVRAQGGP